MNPRKRKLESPENTFMNKRIKSNTTQNSNMEIINKLNYLKNNLDNIYARFDLVMNRFNEIEKRIEKLEEKNKESESCPYIY